MRLLLLLCIVGLACSSPTDAPPGTLGILLATNDDARVTMPDTADVGESFVVEVTTIGLNSCYRQSATVVDQVGSSGTISPYDVQIVGENTGCYEVQIDIHHEATFRFTTPGTATITVRGRDLRGTSAEVIERDFHVVVR